MDFLYTQLQYKIYAFKVKRGQVGVRGVDLGHLRGAYTFIVVFDEFSFAITFYMQKNCFISDTFMDVGGHHI